MERIQGIFKFANRYLQVEDSFTVGGIFGLPIVALLVVFVLVDGLLAKFWNVIFDLSGIERYTFVPGTALLLTLLIFYVSGRVGESDWFMKTFGRILGRIWFIGGLYKKALLLKYTRKGFLQPVWIQRSGALVYDVKTGELEKMILGTERRGFFLREVTTEDQDLPPEFHLRCEVIVPTGQLTGEPELFAFPFVRAQITPSIGEFSSAILTQGFDGYASQRTLRWDKAREIIQFKELSAYDRKLLEGVGVILPKQELPQQSNGTGE